jgi:hypothetical protein
MLNHISKLMNPKTPKPLTVKYTNKINMKLRLQVGLIALFALAGCCYSALFFVYSCTYSGVANLIIYLPPGLTGIIC